MLKLLGQIRDIALEPLLWLVIAWIYWMNMGVASLGQPDEIFVIQPAREMTLNHFWGYPLLNGQPYLEMPPLFTWLVHISFEWFGISLWSARLPATLLGLLGLGVTFALSLSLFNNRLAAFLTTVTLATSWGYFSISHEANGTILYVILLQLFFWLFHWFYQLAARPKLFKGDKQVLSIGLGTVLGLLFLAKGPVGVLLPLTTVIGFLVLTGALERLMSLEWKWTLGVFLLLVLPWPLWVSFQPGQQMFLLSYLFHLPFHHAQLGESYFSGLLSGFFLWLFPWNFFLLGGLIDRKGLSWFMQKNRDAMILVLLWIGLGLVSTLITLETGPAVLMPVYVPLVILVGLYLSKMVESIAASPSYQWAADGVTLMLFGLAVFLTYFVFQFIPDDYPGPLWSMPGPATLSSLFIPLSPSAPGFDLLSKLPFFNKELELPNLFPVWKLWLLPGPFILIISGVLLYLLNKTQRSQEIPIALLGISVISLVFISYIGIPVFSRPVTERLAQTINRRILAMERESHHPAHYTIVINAQEDPDLMRLPFFLNLNSPKRQLASRFWMSESPQATAELLAKASSQHRVLGVMDEKSYYAMPTRTRMGLRVLDNHWQWCAKHSTDSSCWWVHKKDQGNFDRMTDEVLLVEHLLPEPVMPQHPRATDAQPTLQTGSSKSKVKPQAATAR
jgi:4-amino-4-deoxy-L-arabinose transferase-like glycosyltransferase